jgi:hypothetical protein
MTMDALDKDSTLLTFDEWKAAVVEYLHKRTETTDESMFWLIGADLDMQNFGYDQGDTPREYVDYQIECAQ